MDLSGIEPSWRQALNPEFGKGYFRLLCQNVAAERLQYPEQIFPPEGEVFSWTLCPINRVKVVILGQDPYPGVLPDGRPKAHGLAFSIRYPGKAVGGHVDSLQNIFAELQYCYPPHPPQGNHPEFQCPEYGDLTRWAKEEGVVLLNTVLTVREGSAKSHRGLGWETFTDAVIERICDLNTGVMFLLWGNVAKEKIDKLNRDERIKVVDIEKLIREGRIDEEVHSFLESSHPSPQSTNNPFRGCEHFIRTNNLLQHRRKKPINWQNCNDFVTPHQVNRWDHYLSNQPQPFMH